MNRQRGIIAVMYLWIAGGIALTILGLGAWGKIQTSRLEACKSGFETFKAEVRVQGEAAEKEVARVNLVNLKAMEAANHEYAKVKTDLASTYAAYRKLRASAGSRPLSSSTPVASVADRTCYKSGDIIGAVDDLEKSVFGGFDRLDAAVPGVLEQGDSAKSRLIGAMKWAESLAK